MQLTYSIDYCNKLYILNRFTIELSAFKDFFFMMNSVCHGNCKGNNLMIIFVQHILA